MKDLIEFGSGNTYITIRSDLAAPIEIIKLYNRNKIKKTAPATGTKIQE